MAFSTKLKLSDAKFIQESGSTLTLSGDTTIADEGSLQYESHPTFVNDVDIVDKKYVDDTVLSATTSGTTYSLSSPASIDLGGISTGQVLTGLTSNEILEDLLVPYIEPTFSSFAISGQATLVEVDEDTAILSGNNLFTWTTTTSGNVAANSITLRDVTGTADLETGLANDGSETTNVGTINLTANNQTYSWRGEATDTEATDFNSTNFTITAIHPWFYGTVNAPGAAGVGRPTADQDLVTGGTKVVTSSNGTVSMTFGASSGDYLWFAIPSSSTDKIKWYVNELNQGDIGGVVSAGGNLFPNDTGVSVTFGGKWSSVPYRVYVSNYQSATTGAMQMRNS